ncbi:hypothetical protein [Flavobacterium phycosphaerae]|uniref:hypothetical protein n=1 Tax=Flavobacterium phycosphaerae TaxID=2697515 RepID=UPI00138B143F|nr:hypothetical protein [Flavobacterium phycosphaerae]
MKRILSILTLLFIINACDDGDLTIDTIDFSEVTAKKCDLKDIIYKVKDSEMLILAIPATTFPNDQTPDGTPITLPINTTNQVIYRQYSSTVSSDNICPTVPSANPSLTEEWKATAGTIQITSTAIYAPTTSNGTKITNYNHYIVFKNVTFQTPNGTQVYENYVFGNYTTTATALAFGFDTEVQKSTCDNRIFNFNGSEALILDVANYATLFENAVTTTPRTAVIDSTNKLTYQLYSNTVNDTYFCTTPTTPVLSQEWKADNSVTDVSGIIEVTTTTLWTDFQHTIRFKKVTFKRGNSTFYLGDDVLYGSFITTP